MMSFSDRLKKARVFMGKSQKEMALLLGINQRTYENYEKSVNAPSWDACESFVKLGFNANWLLTGEGDMRRSAGQTANGNGFVQGHNVTVEKPHMNTHVGEQPGDYAPKQYKHEFVHDWLEEELRDKTISEVMAIAVKIKSVLDEIKGG